MRLFIAAELPPELIEALSETSAALRGCVRGRYVAPDSFHITLAFLGDVPSARIADITQAINEACEGYGPFTLTLGELGSFGRSRAATIWQGFQVDDGRKQLEALAKDIREALTQSDIAFDAKSFLPHVTLMRAAKLDGGVLPCAAVADGSVNTITLFRSDLSGNRPVYEALSTHIIG